MSVSTSSSPSTLTKGSASNECPGNYAPQTYIDYNSPSQTECRPEAGCTMLLNDNIFMESELFREQIERNRRIADQLSPVRKYMALSQNKSSNWYWLAQVTAIEFYHTGNALMTPELK
ncbi:hypothetical protein TELCIR_00500 [Teladorsagia circumcincta]|uniref:Uncharacterized protein n=1 Tax=Teladorsagia circumcincta TaxID=45464 RepID=A0A2G9V4E2_TELCI|nr:hypothetical protein TELCIR_00500 [Teladorsagia circumcincta]